MSHRRLALGAFLLDGKGSKSLAHTAKLTPSLIGKFLLLPLLLFLLGGLEGRSALQGEANGSSLVRSAGTFCFRFALGSLFPQPEGKRLSVFIGYLFLTIGLRPKVIVDCAQSFYSQAPQSDRGLRPKVIVDNVLIPLCFVDSRSNRKRFWSNGRRTVPEH